MKAKNLKSQKMNKEELIEHIRTLDKEAAQIYNIVASDSTLSKFKINLLIRQLKCICDEVEVTLNPLTDKMEFETKLYTKLIIPSALILSVTMMFTYLISYPVGLLLNIGSMNVNFVVLKKALKHKEINKNIEDSLEIILPKFSHTLSNCSIFLARHNDRQISESKINNVEEVFVNNIVWELLNGANLIEADEKLRSSMIKSLQEELNVSESDLTKLLGMARGIYYETPFMEQTEEVLKLSRTKKAEKKSQQ